ncbi:hypothetical protein [Acidiphilium angustum]|uniref:hypothetical protein n=1 Tax=Acidiphilium angustum TaxID=523 RepID=UPI000493F28E|nr:hypothetical protein [Acidiphilium angustum]
MSITLVIYDSVGAILQVTQCAPNQAQYQQSPAGGGILATAPIANPSVFIKQNCVIGGQIVPKVGMGLSVSATSFPADGTSDVTIGEIPAGASVMISGAVSAGPETITDGQLAITSNVAGSILVTITAPPMYFDWSITLVSIP